MGKVIQVAQAWTIAANVGEEVLLGYRDVGCGYLYTSADEAAIMAERMNKIQRAAITLSWRPHKTIIRVMED